LYTGNPCFSVYNMEIILYIYKIKILDVEISFRGEDFVYKMMKKLYIYKLAVVI